MPVTTETVLIEFQADYSQLDAAIDTLVKTGQIDAKLAQSFKQTTKELANQANAVKQVENAERARTKTTQQGLNTLKQMDTAVKQEVKSLRDLDKQSRAYIANFVKGFEEGVIAELTAAQEEVDELKSKLQSGSAAGGGATSNLRKELKQLTLQIAEAKATGGPVDQAMIERAGQLKDAINDANQEIRNAGSDTRGLDNLIGSTQAVVGSFALAQGAAGLFGDENEELQKTLLKVNSAMAILQGLQAIQNALQKEGAITLTIANTQRAIQNAQLAVQAALESRNIILRGAATVAQKALNLAIASNPIGLLIVALTAVIPLMLAYANNTRKAAQEQGLLNAAISSSGELLEAELTSLENSNRKTLADMEERNNKGSQLAQQEIANLRLVNQARQRELARANAALSETENSTSKETIELRKTLQERINQITRDGVATQTEIYEREAQLRRQITEETLKSQLGATEAALARAAEGSRQQLNLQKAVIKQRRDLELSAAGLLEGEKAAIRAKANEEILAADAAFNEKLAAQQVANLNNRLINVEVNTVEEFKLRSRLISAQAEQELTNIKLSEEEKNLIRQRAFEEQVLLQRNFDRKRSEIAIEDEVSRNQRILAQRNITDQERLEATVRNIELTAAAEVVAADFNSVKIKEIYARRDRDIREAQRQSIADAADYEIEINRAVEGSRRRANERILRDERTNLKQRIAAIGNIARLELDENETRIRALDEMYQKKLISDKEYNLAHERLLDERARINEETEERIAATTRERIRRTVQDIVGAAQFIAGQLGAIADERERATQIQLENQKKIVQEQLEAGQITEKEAEARNKRIELLERQAQQRAAVRAKQIAIFQALIATAQAVAQALTIAPPAGIALAAVIGALGAAQVAAIANRPIPRFAKGKKRGEAYEGLGLVAEAGTELVERNGRMYVIKQPAIMNVRRDDTIYTARETAAMLKNTAPRVNTEAMAFRPEPGGGQEIDYNRLAQAIVKAMPPAQKNDIIIDKDFIINELANGLSRVQYMNRYYSSRQ